MNAAPAMNGYRLDELEFHPIPHQYFVRDRELVSVTTRMRENGIGFTGFAPQEALDRGNTVHEASQFLDDGDQLDWSSVPEKWHGYCQGYLKARLAEPRVKILAAERRVWHPVFWYAGTLDRSVLVISDGKRRVRELKTGSTNDVDVQVAAYAHAYNCWFPNRPVDTEVGECLRVYKNGDFKLFPLDLREGWQDFAAILRLERRRAKPKYATT